MSSGNDALWGREGTIKTRGAATTPREAGKGRSRHAGRQRCPGRPGRGDQDTRGGNDAPGGREGAIKTRGAATTPREAGKGRSRHAGRQRCPGRSGRDDQDTRGGVRWPALRPSSRVSSPSCRTGRRSRSWRRSACSPSRRSCRGAARPPCGRATRASRWTGTRSAAAGWGSPAPMSAHPRRSAQR